MKIRKAIIPCGGRGTRFLPITKAVAKEILPIIDTPVLAYIVDEIIDSGINEIMIVLGPGKEDIRSYFTENAELEAALKDKPELLELVRKINRGADIRFAVQEVPRGSADAVMLTREFAAGEPFCMSNGDDLMVSDIPVTKQLMAAYEQSDGVIMGVQQVEVGETSKYGIIKPKEIIGRRVICDGIIEKPKSNPPSRYAALGRYVFTPEIFDYIERMEEKDGEYNVTNAIADMMNDGKVYAYEFEGKRYDMGNKFGALTATVDFALKNAELKDKFKAYLKDMLRNES